VPAAGENKKKSCQDEQQDHDYSLWGVVHQQQQARKEESSQQQLDATSTNGNSNDLFVLIYWY
jgi:hypothetical protein